MRPTRAMLTMAAVMAAARLGEGKHARAKSRDAAKWKRHAKVRRAMAKASRRRNR